MSRVRSESVTIVEVGLRDGLQNESVIVNLEHRLDLILKLIDSGLIDLEVGSFVSPKWVPAMEVSEKLFEEINQKKSKGELSKSLNFSALVPNEKGLDKALLLGIKEIALFAACSESFSQKNTNCSLDESFKRLSSVAQRAIDNGIKVRGYLSTCFGCPFEGAIDLQVVKDNVGRMIDLGAYEISLGDTIGIASVGDVEKLLNELFRTYSSNQLAGHFHDTRGQAVANIYRSYQMGLRVFDSSIGGLGGCPYAPGATGNVATEDVVYLFESLGVSTGVSLSKLLKINLWLSSVMNKNLPSRVGLAQTFDKIKPGKCFL